jgi:hypothetical protein
MVMPSPKGKTTRVCDGVIFVDDALDRPRISENLVWKWIGYAFPQKRNQRRCDEVLSAWDICPLLPCRMAWENLGGGGSRSRGT